MNRAEAFPFPRGVMQINAIHSNDVSGSGVNDTTSLDKEISAVVTARFGLR